MEAANNTDETQQNEINNSGQNQINNSGAGGITYIDRASIDDEKEDIDIRTDDKAITDTNQIDIKQIDTDQTKETKDIVINPKSKEDEEKKLIAKNRDVKKNDQ